MPANAAHNAAGFRALVEVYARRLPWYTLPADTCKKTTDALAAEVCCVRACVHACVCARVHVRHCRGVIPALVLCFVFLVSISCIRNLSVAL